jgi:hypothetical protein
MIRAVLLLGGCGGDRLRRDVLRFRMVGNHALSELLYISCSLSGSEASELDFGNPNTAGTARE